MITLYINGQKVKGKKDQTILEVARENGIDIPTLCHDDRVEPFGACGLCVVEVEGYNRLIRACATKIEENMVVYTDTPRVVKSRQNTLNLMLSDHTGDCRPPCLKACPANTDCQGYVGLIANGQYKEAVSLIMEKLPLPASIGLVCPHPCEEACRRKMVDDAVAIAALKAFAGFYNLQAVDPYLPEVKEVSGKKVAVVGAGPAGLTAAYFLALKGHKVDIYEAMPEPGGMLRYGIPEYRLPKTVLDKEIGYITRLGVNIITNTRLGVDVKLEELRSRYDAVFLGIGAWVSSKIGCPGEESEGVVGGIEFLRRVAMKEPIKIGRKVAVIGGGNTAMDAARTAIRMGAEEVMVLYRRTRSEMPAEDIEVKEAEEEGVIFKFLVAPEEIIAQDGKVRAIKMQKMQLGEPDASGRRKPVPIPGEVEIIEADMIIAAIGQQVNTEGLEGVGLNRWGTIEVDETTFMTNLEGVFAGGDVVAGPKIAIEAVAQGGKAAQVIDSYLRGHILPLSKSYYVQRQMTPEDLSCYPKQSRVEIRHLPPEVRKNNFKQVSAIYTVEEAVNEAKRCLECGCLDYFECKLIQYANRHEVNPERLQGAKHIHVPVDYNDYIIREPDKCILCGLCVRICDEVMGVTALGYVNRGFDVLVQPEFNLPLEETECITCGQCVSVCPTGALVENSQKLKKVPLKLETEFSVCSFCNTGCRQKLFYKGNKIYKVLPVDNGLLCFNGRFAHEGAGERILRPLLRKDGVFTEVGWEEAYAYIREKVSQLPASNIIFSISPAYTMEEIKAVQKLSEQCFASSYIGSFSHCLPEKMLSKVNDCSLEELENADTILVAGEFKDYPIALVKTRRAVSEGAKLILVGPEPGLIADKALVKIENIRIFLDEMQAIINNENTSGSDSPWITVYQLLSSGKTMFLLDGARINKDIIEELGILAHHWGSKVIYITRGANFNGLLSLGVGDAHVLVNKLEKKEARAVFVWGEDPVGEGKLGADFREDVELLVVSAPYMHETAKIADVVLPGSISWEVEGTYWSLGNEVIKLNRVVSSPHGKDNIMVINELGDALCK
ncbi:formate dehydrogenase major subunit [Thermosyntropha lipolytica DSM 11003]|uniref:Formate dehydrogenase major subunit n=1 Tax=Thermosyntropha lipolytica DSM 11003 TaxID=1123382 RepID=A0A1M5NEW6_9FIRM|nr:NAD(P)-binding protein [Thermosyntropha lipolytica]SHG87513.1 formate dehydrogenase major subunit [Thermosyntropha lipolytica DSM 11003]